MCFFLGFTKKVKYICGRFRFTAWNSLPFGSHGDTVLSAGFEYLKLVMDQLSEMVGLFVKGGISLFPVLQRELKSENKVVRMFLCTLGVNVLSFLLPT